MNRIPRDKTQIKILLLEGVHQNAVEVLQRAGYTNIEYHKGSLSDDELKEAIKDARFIGIRSRTMLTDEVLACANELAVIGCFCIGTNQVDLKAAAKRGIPVFNAPFSNTRSVAELVLAEIIFMYRGIPKRNAMAHNKQWWKSADGSHEVRGKKLGIIGYGHIGTQVSVLAEALGMHVYYYDIENKLALGNAAQVYSMGELLKTCDVISMHVPETPETKNMMGRAHFAAMKPGAFFINAARGSVVDVEALCKELDSGHIAGAAVDVFPTEPKTNNDPFISPLTKYDNVILTPHVGGSTQEAQENIGTEVSEKLVKYADNGSTVSAFNFPEVALPQIRDCTRLLHIHENRPGILNNINTLFANEHINIAAQFLQTDNNVGYVVIDVESEGAEEILEKLKAVEGTIRARILY